VDDVLAIQRELNRATTELEQLKGRKRVLENLIDLTTVTVHLQERGVYEPPESAPFDTTIGRTFSGSIDAMITVGKGIVLGAVAVTPWLPVLVVAVAPFWWLRRRRKAARTAGPAPEPKAP
jgi:hypothetical protein